MINVEGNELIDVRKATDISHEEARTYHYRDGSEVEIEHPVMLTVAADGSHHFTCADRVGQIVPPGWSSIDVWPRFGKAAFEGHPVPSHMAD